MPTSISISLSFPPIPPTDSQLTHKSRKRHVRILLLMLRIHVTHRSHRLWTSDAFWDQQSIPALVQHVAIDNITDQKFREIVLGRYQTVVGAFVEDIEGFSRTLGTYSGVVSGSSALSFFSGPGWFMPDDLDVYVPHGKSAGMVDWLTATQGYVRRGDDEPQDLLYYGKFSEDTGVAVVFTLYNGDNRIDVVECIGDSVFSALCRFWCTGVINFFNESGWGSAYPRALDLHRSLVSEDTIRQGSGKFYGMVMKYRLRGVRTFMTHTEWTDGAECDGNNESCPARWRYFGDQYSMVGWFAEGKSLQLNSRELGLEHTVVWRLGGVRCQEGTCGNAGGSDERFELSPRMRNEVENWLFANGSDVGARELGELLM